MPFTERSEVDASEDTVRLVVEALVRDVSPATERVPVAVMLVAVRFPEKYPVPATERVVKGEVVPIPTLPFADTLKSVAPLDEATLKRSAVWPASPSRASVMTFPSPAV